MSIREYFLSDIVHFVQLETVFVFVLSRHFGQETLKEDNGPAIVGLSAEQVFSNSQSLGASYGEGDWMN